MNEAMFMTKDVARIRLEDRGTNFIIRIVSEITAKPSAASRYSK